MSIRRHALLQVRTFCFLLAVSAGATAGPSALSAAQQANKFKLFFSDKKSFVFLIHIFWNYNRF